jgi:hypothetical protein
VKPVIQILQERLEEVKVALRANREQQIAMKGDEADLVAERDELQAAVDFIRNRTP